MIITRFDGSAERKILIAMVVNKTVLAAISGRWTNELFSSRWANIIGGICVNFYRQYRYPPLNLIEGLIDAWAETGGKDKEIVKLMDDFLRGLSSEYTKSDEDINPQYVLDLASQYFNKVSLRQLARELNGHLDAGDLEAALKCKGGHKDIEIGAGAGINVFSEDSAVTAMFAEKQEPLIRYPGSLGNFFGDTLERDGFVSFLGKEKVGKTFWLLDMAWQALTQQRKVAIFSIGDMSQSQMLRRIASRASRMPMKAGVIQVPRELHIHDGEPQVVREEVKYDNDLTEAQIVRVFKSLRNEYGELSLKLSTHPNLSVTVDGIRSVMDSWDRNEDHQPDVVVLDYADNIAPIKNLLDSRAQIDYTWKSLRGLSQERHNLVVTATQSNKASYKAETVDRSNITEDKRKLAHVTGMIGINCKSGEQGEGIYRLNWVVRREQEFDENVCCFTAACLAIANPAMHSSF